MCAQGMARLNTRHPLEVTRILRKCVLWPRIQEDAPSSAPDTTSSLRLELVNHSNTPDVREMKTIFTRNKIVTTSVKM